MVANFLLVYMKQIRECRYYCYIKAIWHNLIGCIASNTEEFLEVTSYHYSLALRLKLILLEYPGIFVRTVNEYGFPAILSYAFNFFFRCVAPAFEVQQYCKFQDRTIFLCLWSSSLLIKIVTYNRLHVICNYLILQPFKSVSLSFSGCESELDT